MVLQSRYAFTALLSRHGEVAPVWWHTMEAGFVWGGLDNEVALCRKWTALGGVAVNVDYRLAPENAFPAAVYDAYDSLIWVCHPYPGCMM